MGSVNGCLVFGVGRELLEGEGEIQAATRANSLNAGFTILQCIHTVCLACDKMHCCGICLEQGFA